MENMSVLAGGGMAGMALVSAVFASSDIEGETRRIKKKIQEVIHI